MAEKRQYAPMSTAGLIRYFDEEESQIRINPEHVIYFSIGFAALVLILRFLV
ncbi:MAG: preprotein translocase subunit Sec61beta [Candidatus Aenigmatarchaeota archaeon]